MENTIRRPIAPGMDSMAAEAVLDLQEDFPDVTLEIAVPFEGQADKWHDSYRARWQRCIDRAGMIAVLSRRYTEGAICPESLHGHAGRPALLSCVVTRFLQILVTSGGIR